MKPKLTGSDILEAEKAAAERQENRKSGYSMVHIRDQGGHRLENGTVIYWPVPNAENSFQSRPMRKGTFILDIDGKKTVFDVEEFRKWIRWA